MGVKRNYTPPSVIRNPVLRNPVSQIPDSFYFLAEEIEILERQQTNFTPRSVKLMQNPFEKYRYVPDTARRRHRICYQWKMFRQVSLYTLNCFHVHETNGKQKT